MAKGGGAKGPSKKTVEKAKSKLVEDKTFGLKNKNKSKKVQTQIKHVKNTVNQVHDKKTKKEMEERERKRMEKLLEKKREEELKALFKSADGTKKDEANDAATQDETTVEQEADLYDRIEEELAEEEEMTLEDIIEKERAKIVGGTPVTLESFTKWKQFKLDMAMKDEERRKKAALESGHGLTGRDLFEHNKNLFVDDEEAADTDAYARDEDVDEDLFLEDDDESSSQPEPKKDEDEFDPDTWKEPKLPKVLLQEYLAGKKLALPKYETIPLPNNQQGHYIKVVLPHNNREYIAPRVYPNKKNAEHGAALKAYRDLTKTFL